MKKQETDKILTLNPDSTKKGVNVDKDRYDFIKSVILKMLKVHGPLSSRKLVEVVVDHVNSNGGVEYSIGWYAMAVRLDLEARGEVLYGRADKKPLISLPSKV